MALWSYFSNNTKTKQRIGVLFLNTYVCIAKFCVLVAMATAFFCADISGMGPTEFNTGMGPKEFNTVVVFIYFAIF